MRLWLLTISPRDRKGILRGSRVVSFAEVFLMRSVWRGPLRGWNWCFIWQATSVLRARWLSRAELNVGGLLTALEAARNGGCGRVVFASSAAVYGNGPEMPKVEGLSPTPESPYALTKLDGERYLRMLGPLWGFATTAVRFFNVFGPRQNIATGYAAAVPNFCSLAARGKEIRIYGDGEQTRDFVYVEDLVSALHHLACTGVHSGIYNVGYGESLTINSLAKSIIEMSGSSSRITYDVERPGDVRHSLADVALLRATGWKATVGMQDGLMRTIGFHANSGGAD